jgi:DNA phosphorothioation-dependent restriction protein DptG
MRIEIYRTSRFVEIVSFKHMFHIEMKIDYIPLRTKDYVDTLMPVLTIECLRRSRNGKSSKKTFHDLYELIKFIRNSGDYDVALPSLSEFYDDQIEDERMKLYRAADSLKFSENSNG